MSSRNWKGIVWALVVAVAVGAGSLFAGQAADTQPSQASPASKAVQTQAGNYRFRSTKLLNEHFEKHGVEMGFQSADEYVAAANDVIADPSSLHKLEREDGDDVYYRVSTDEIVFVSTDGYIRTYFNPGGIGYYNRQ